MKLAVARLWFCSNSSGRRRTLLSDVVASEWTNSPHALRHPTGGSEFDGLARFLANRPHWQPTLLRAASASSRGPLSAEVFGSWLAEVEAGLRRGRFDGVYLSLHGACQADGLPVADLTVMQRVRAAVGQTPVVASFDMHANLPLETTLLLDGASANRCWPEGGGDDAAIRALTLLEGIVEGRFRPVGAMARVAAPAHDLDLFADSDAAMADGVLDWSVMRGFPLGDADDAHACAMVWTDRDARLARETLEYFTRSGPGFMPDPPARRSDLGPANVRLDRLDRPADAPRGLAALPERLRALLRHPEVATIARNNDFDARGAYARP